MYFNEHSKGKNLKEAKRALEKTSSRVKLVALIPVFTGTNLASTESSWVVWNQPWPLILPLCLQTLHGTNCLTGLPNANTSGVGKAQKVSDAVWFWVYIIAVGGLWETGNWKSHWEVLKIISLEEKLDLTKRIHVWVNSCLKPPVCYPWAGSSSSMIIWHLRFSMAWLPWWLRWLKSLPVMSETWVQSLGWEDPLEKGMAIHSVFLTGEFYGQKGLEGYSPWGHKEADMTEQLTFK